MAIKLKKNIHNSVQTPSRMCIIHVQAHNTPHTRTQTLDWQPNNNELETAIKAMMQTEQRQRQIWQKIKRSETINVGLQRVQKRERDSKEKRCLLPINCVHNQYFIEATMLHIYSKMPKTATMANDEKSKLSTSRIEYIVRLSINPHMHMYDTHSAIWSNTYPHNHTNNRIDCRALYTNVRIALLQRIYRQFAIDILNATFAFIIWKCESRTVTAPITQFELNERS